MFAVLTCLQELDGLKSRSCSSSGISKLELLASLSWFFNHTIYICIYKISIYNCLKTRKGGEIVFQEGR